MSTPAYQNSSPAAPSPFQFAASSSSSHNFFYSTTHHDQQYQSGYYDHKELQQPLIIQQDQADNFASQFDIENESSDNGLKFSIWKKEDKYANHHQETPNYQVKWMSSKLRMMHKMEKVDPTAVNAPPTMLKLEDQKQIPSSPLETENSSNSSSNNSNMSPIRVCSDCNTTKTPLWRSGPQGPKSLCNACGIRQRKARRAMAAAAAAAANGTAIQTEKTPVVLVKTTKTQQKDKRSSTTTGHVAKYKKRSSKLQAAATNNSSHQAIKKLCFEDFLLSLSKNLAFHRVFPQDEKEAAILLMALSCGHVHG